MIDVLRTILIAAAALIGAATFAWAEDLFDPDKGCDGGTYEIVECLNAKTAQWDKRLNVAYRQALKDTVPQQRDPLRQAQRAWIKFRDAQCDFVAAGEGSIARIEAAECLRSMTERRAKELAGESGK